ncbi:phosphodiester glycosidase family protein [Halobacillus sp. BBL2006]|uniref:phosphodiester glycosidase family protein n=1 Tax=Halobacillus sp. BBL2006 TaxID=1543706 RepID=UPI000541D1B9|nr:phosphodiester glycosidase family protein [Halobacillus sp. BBL2006]KHE68586.1 hypothetical protein LD39_14320 [Halobacillus sp. BBL2006]
MQLLSITLKIFFILHMLVISTITPGWLNLNVLAEEKQESNQTQATLPIGKKDLPETRTTKQLAKGVTYTQIARGYQSKKSYYTVDVAFYKTKSQAKTTANTLQKNGYSSDIHKIKNKHSQFTDVKEKKIGYVVRIGGFSDKKKAEKLEKQLKDDGYEEAGVTYSEYDGTTKTTGPWQLDVVEVDPDQFEGKLTNSLAHGKIKGRETVSSMADRLKAIAGINGGYFVFSKQDGIPGDPAGAYMIDGDLVSEGVGSRTGLLLSNQQAEIGEVKTTVSVETDKGDLASIDGINREPGLIRSCGGLDDQPTTKPKHDVTCKDKAEILLYNQYFGKTTPKGEGYEVMLNKEGKVIQTYSQRGHSLPESGSVLSATGKQADWLKERVSVGDKLKITKKVFLNGKQVDKESQVNLVGGGPQLLENGQTEIQADEEGFHWSSDFYYHFAQYRHPRTFAGIKENGNLLFVTVDGRQPKESIGLSFFESAEVLKSLGAVQGMNLDGGGSSTMVVENQLVNHPSDKTGERPVSDGIFLVEN